MDIKEYAIGGAVVIGGVVYGVSQGGLGDALTEDVKHISTISEQERSAYMGGIVQSFTENFSTYIVQTETYDYVGLSTFSAKAADGMFVEVVKSQESTSAAEIEAVKAEMKATDFCEQAEMTLFTDKGWQYRFMLQDHKGHRIYQITCQSGVPKLRLS